METPIISSNWQKLIAFLDSKMYDGDSLYNFIKFNKLIGLSKELIADAME